jgi:hypothetical protein
MEQTNIVSIPVRAGGLVKMSDLRDLVEATDAAAEDDIVSVTTDEIRWEAS